MTDLITWAMPYIITAGAAIAGLAAIWFGGRKSAQTDAKIKAADSAAKATEDMNHADQMRDASDDDRVERLRDFAKRNGRP